MQHDYLGRIRVSGADAETFLQGQLTQDLRGLTDGVPRWAGYCSPKGRLLAVMQLHRVADGISLDMHRSVLDASLKRLKMFVLRAKVTLDTEPVSATASELEWRRAGIETGIPVIYPQTSDHFVPQMVNLDQLGGISFNKGCYTGQEIVARLHYLGNLKRRMFLLHSAENPPPGTDIFADGQPQPVGEVVDAVQGENGCVLSTVLQLGSATGTALRLHAPDGPATGPAQPYHYPASGSVA